MQGLSRAYTLRAFTLIELVIVITLMSAVGLLVAQLMSQPFTQYEAASRRAELTSLANAALNRVTIDLQNAVPNSVRVDNSDASVTFLELILAIDGGRYRDDGNTSVDDTSLTPNIADSRFHVLGRLRVLDPSNFPSNARLVINPFATASLYSAASGTAGIGMMTPDATVITLTEPVANEARFSLSSPFTFDPFGAGSARKRMYVTQTGVIYRCSETSQELRRYTNYDIEPALADVDLSSGDQALVLNSISSCEFLYNSAISQRLGVVTANLQVTDENETVSLVKQVRVFNVP